VLCHKAQIYEQEENDQQAYLLLMRYATLVAEDLPRHPGAKDSDNKKALRAATRAIPDVVVRLETLKPGIEARYSSWETALARKRASTGITDPGENVSESRTSFDLAKSDPAVAGNPTTLAAAEHGELAVKLAHKEIRRRDAARRATRQAGITEEEELERRTAGLWDDWEAALSKDCQAGDDIDMRRRMEDSRRRMDASDDVREDGARKRLSKLNRNSLRLAQDTRPSSEYRYPLISKTQPLHYDEWQRDPRRSLEKEILPPVPAKQSLYNTTTHDTVAPARPEKQPIYDTPSLTPSPVQEPPSFTFRPSAYLENGNPLRTVFLPPSLRERFLSIAAPNTRANLETCGILCGTLISNALFISRLVIPEQESTSDTCETVNESALFDYCDAEDLMVLGWIHTHPTQTCFMSSRDLHTHCGYQVMMPESIAIVCAPSKMPSYVPENVCAASANLNRWGVFRLTDPPGMQSVLKCQQTGLFHPHAESDIYTDALRPGHVFEAKGLEFEVVDLRPQL
jgi:STAM-binding protein